MQPHPVISKSSIWFRLPLFKICRNITTYDWRRPIVIVYWSTNMFCLKPQWFPESERKITTLLLIAVYDTRGEAFIHRTTPFISKLFPTRSYLAYHILYHSMFFLLYHSMWPKRKWSVYHFYRNKSSCSRNNKSLVVNRACRKGEQLVDVISDTKGNEQCSCI